MEFIASILLAVFVALVIGFAFTFGLTVLLALIFVGSVFTAWALLREALRRWRFLHTAKGAYENRPDVIEAEYQDVTHHDSAP